MLFVCEIKMEVPGINKVKKFISLQGNIGAGKSTFLEKLKTIIQQRGLLSSILLIEEPVKQWEEKIYNGESILQLFYDDQSLYGFRFQINAFTTRINLYIESLRECNASDGSVLLISERSMRSDKLFFSNLYEHKLISASEWNIYNQFFDTICNHLNSREEIMLYLDVDYMKCYERIEARGRGEEKNIKLEYLLSLQTGHHKMLEDFAQDPQKQVIKINWIDMTDEEQIIFINELLDELLLTLD